MARLEGTTTRGTELGKQAGALYEKAYRLEWRKEDGDGALEAYRLAAQRPFAVGMKIHAGSMRRLRS